MGSAKVMITFFSLILTLNNHIFNCSQYLQIMGGAIGTTCTSSYPNIFMANFEAKHIYLYIKGCFCYMLDILTTYL